MYTREQLTITVNNLLNNLQVKYGTHALIITLITYYVKPITTDSSGLYSSISELLATIFATIFIIIILLPQTTLTINNLWNSLWIRYGYYAFLIWLIACYLGPVPTDSSGLYSSISTILATIFALVFSVMLLLLQVIKKEYKAMDIVTHNKHFLFVSYFFLVSIMIPVLAIKTDYNVLEPFHIRSSIVANFTQSFCIASLAYAFLLLIPLSNEMSRMLKYDRVETLYYMKADGMKESEMEERIRELSYLGKDLVNTNYDYNKTFIVPLLGNAGIESINKEWTNSAKQVLYALEEIGLKTMDKTYSTTDLDIESITKVTKEIGIIDITKKPRSSQDPPIAVIAAISLGKMSIKAIRTGKRPFIIDIFQSRLLELGKKAIDIELEYLGTQIAYEMCISKWLIRIYMDTNNVETKKRSMSCLRELNTYIHKSSPVIAKVCWDNDFTELLKSTNVYTQYNTACYDFDNPQVPYP